MKLSKSVSALLVLGVALLVLTGCPNGIGGMDGTAQPAAAGEPLGVIGAINGTLVDHDGEAVEGAEIQFYRTVEPEETDGTAEAAVYTDRDAPFSIKAGEIGTATTDSHGFFIIDDLTSGFYVVTFKKDGYAFGRYIVYIPTIDEIEKASGIDFESTDSNTTIYLEDDTGREYANITASGLTYSFTAMLQPVLYGRVAGVSGTVKRTTSGATSEPAAGVTVVATVMLPSGFVMTYGDGETTSEMDYFATTVEFSAVTDANGNFAIPDEMPAAFASIETEPIYYAAEDLWYPAAEIEVDLNLRAGTTGLGLTTIAPSVERPLVLAYDGDITSPIAVDQDLTVTFSVPIDTLTAQLTNFDGGSVPLDLDVALSTDRRVATLTDPGGDFPAYDLGTETLALNGTTVAGDAITDVTSTIYTPDSMQIVDTNVYNAGGYYNPTAMQRLYDEAAKVIDFPLTGGIITVEFDQELASVGRVELYRVDGIEGSQAIFGPEVATTPIVSGNTLTITVDDPLVDEVESEYYLAFEVASTRPEDTFQTQLDSGAGTGDGSPNASSQFINGIAYLEYRDLYADATPDEYVAFDTQQIRVETANVYDDEGSIAVVYSAPETITAAPETDFPAADDIVLTFTRDLDQTEPNAFTLIDNSDGSEVALAAPVITDNSVTLDPTVDLTPGGLYTIEFEVFAAPTDSAANALDFRVTGPTGTFALIDTNFGAVGYTAGELDPIAAAGAGSGTFVVTDDIELVFDESLDTTPASHFVELYTDSGIDVSVDTYDITVTIGTTILTDDTIVIDPTDDLDPDVVYNVRFEALSAGADTFANEDATDVEIPLAFRTTDDALIFPAEAVTNFYVVDGAGDVDTGGLIDWNATTVQVEWDRVTNPTSQTAYRIYADIVDAAGTTTFGRVPVLLDPNNDGTYDTYVYNDADNTTFAEKQVARITGVDIDLSRSINNNYEYIFGGDRVDTGGIFTYGNRVNLFITASDSVGEGESTLTAATSEIGGNAIPLRDRTAPGGSVTGTLPAAGASATWTFSATEDMPYSDPATLVTEIGADSGVGGADFTIDSVTWEGSDYRTILINVSLATGATGATGDGVQVDFTDTSGNAGTAQRTY